MSEVQRVDAKLEVTEAQWMAFREDLRSIINRHSMENVSNTPDHLLAAHLIQCLMNFNAAAVERDRWYHGKVMEPGR